MASLAAAAAVVAAVASAAEEVSVVISTHVTAAAAVLSFFINRSSCFDPKKCQWTGYDLAELKLLTISAAAKDNEMEKSLLWMIFGTCSGLPVCRVRRWQFAYCVGAITCQENGCAGEDVRGKESDVV
jgi:hypothetical protein